MGDGLLVAGLRLLLGAAGFEDGRRRSEGAGGLCDGPGDDGAVDRAGRAVPGLLHRVSPGPCSPPEDTRTSGWTGGQARGTRPRRPSGLSRWRCAHGLANLSGASPTGTSLRAAKLTGTSLRAAKLTGTSLRAATPTGAPPRAGRKACYEPIYALLGVTRSRCGTIVYFGSRAEIRPAPKIAKRVVAEAASNVIPASAVTAR